MKTWGTKLDAALTGGEPFLKPELLQLLHKLDDSDQVGDLSIITNGTAWPPYARELVSLSRFREMRISIDGTSNETNDEIRGKGVLANVIKNIHRWQDLGIPVTIMFTVMKRNYHEIEGLTEFGEKLGIGSIVIERFFPIGRGNQIEKDVLDGREFLEVWQKILGTLNISADPADLISYRAIRINFHESENDVLGSGCVVGKDGMAILPDGTILPCRRFALPIGNIIDTPLDEIWNHSPVLNALRDKTQLKGKCGQCSIEECQGCRAMCYCLEKDFLAEDPHCWI